MASTYYLSPKGNDLNAGTSQALAWRSLDKLNQTTFAAGDSILLEGGESFTGGLILEKNLSQESDERILIRSYGEGKATILAGREHGIYVLNGAGLEISNLILRAQGPEYNDHSGIMFHKNIEDGNWLANIHLHQLEISGFNRGGITIFGEEYIGPAYQRIRIEYVKAYNNGDHGIGVLGQVMKEGHAMKDIYVAHCEVHHNLGQPGKTNAHTGNGIVVGNTDGIVIEYCIAYENGAGNLYKRGGPIGIWMWDCKDGIIQFCESHHNRTGSSKDGGGFDLDGGCQNCIIQYCYSHDNEGAGFLVAEYDGARPLLNNYIRFNISENDGRKNGYGSITVWCGRGILRELFIYNNTIFQSPGKGKPNYVFRTLGGGTEQILLANNAFMSISTSRLLHLDQNNEQLLFLNNAYYHAGGDIWIRDGDRLFTSLSSWRKVQQQEVWMGKELGFEGDLHLEKPGEGRTIGKSLKLEDMKAYRLKAKSPLMGAGVMLPINAKPKSGQKDFFQHTFFSDHGFNVGADAFYFLYED